MPAPISAALYMSPDRARVGFGVLTDRPFSFDLDREPVGADAKPRKEGDESIPHRPVP